MLLHFLFLHQTATTYQYLKIYLELLHFLFLHQTATITCQFSAISCCYISCFYIKPQLFTAESGLQCVATFLVSTSNRNPPTISVDTKALLHFLFLHQTATKVMSNFNHVRLLHFLFLHQTAT